MSAATWGNQVTMDWLVLNLTGSAQALGRMVIFQLAPYIFISLLGGSIADRFNKRNFLMLVVFLDLIISLSLFFLYRSGGLNYSLLSIVALISGTINAMEAPVRTALSLEVVKKENVSNVMGLNSVTFNLGRFGGTLFAGMLIAHFGNGAPWFALGVIYFSLLLLLPLLRVHEIYVENFGAPKLGKMSDAFKYLFNAPVLLFPMLLASVFTGLGMQFGLTSSLMVKRVFLERASYLGYVGMAIAAGSILGAAIAARWSVPEHVPQVSTMLKSGVIVGAFWVISAEMPNFWLYAFIAGVASIFNLMFMVTSNSLVASRAPEDFQGRIYGIYLFIFYIGATVGGPIIGQLAQQLSVRMAILIGGLVTLAISGMALLWSLRTAP